MTSAPDSKWSLMIPFITAPGFTLERLALSLSVTFKRRCDQAVSVIREL